MASAKKWTRRWCKTPPDRRKEEQKRKTTKTFVSWFIQIGDHRVWMPRQGATLIRESDDAIAFETTDEKKRDEMTRENLRGLLDAMRRRDFRVHVVVLSGTDGSVERKRGRLKERLSTFTDSHDEYVYSKTVNKSEVSGCFYYNSPPFVCGPEERKKTSLRKKKADDNTSLLIIRREGASGSEGQRQTTQLQSCSFFFFAFFHSLCFCFFSSSCFFSSLCSGKTCSLPFLSHPKQQQTKTHRPRVYVWSRYWGAGAKTSFPPLSNNNAFPNKSREHIHTKNKCSSGVSSCF